MFGLLIENEMSCLIENQLYIQQLSIMYGVIFQRILNIVCQNWMIEGTGKQRFIIYFNWESRYGCWCWRFRSNIIPHQRLKPREARDRICNISHYQYPSYCEKWEDILQYKSSTGEHAEFLCRVIKIKIWCSVWTCRTAFNDIERNSLKVS